MDLFDAGFSAVPYLSETASKFQQTLLTLFFIFWVISLYGKIRSNLALHANLARGKVVVVDGVGSLLQAVSSVRYSHLNVIFRQRQQTSPAVPTEVHRSASLPSISCPPGDASSTADAAKLSAKLVFPAQAAGTCLVAFGIPNELVESMLAQGSDGATSGDAAAASSGGRGSAAAASHQTSTLQQHSQANEDDTISKGVEWSSSQWSLSIVACLQAAHNTRALPLPAAGSPGSAARSVAVDSTLHSIALAMGVQEPAGSIQAVLQQLAEIDCRTPAVVFHRPAAGRDAASPPTQAIVLGLQGECPPLQHGSEQDDVGAEWTMRFTQRAYLLLPGGAVQLDAVFGLEAGEEDACCVCLTEPKQVLLLPCRHLCVCTTCFQQLSRCPVCRSSFQSNLVVAGLQAAAATEHDADSSTGDGGEGGITAEEAADVEAVARAMGAEQAEPSNRHRKAQTQ